MDAKSRDLGAVRRMQKTTSLNSELTARFDARVAAPAVSPFRKVMALSTTTDPSLMFERATVTALFAGRLAMILFLNSVCLSLVKSATAPKASVAVKVTSGMVAAVDGVACTQTIRV